MRRWACSTGSARSSPAGHRASARRRAGAWRPKARAVAVVDIDGDRADEVAQSIDGIAYAVDVTDFDALDARRARRRTSSSAA